MRVLGLTLAGAPTWVAKALRSPALLFAARLALTSAYWVGGLAKLSNRPAAVAEVRQLGMHPVALIAAATIAAELSGSVLVVSGRLVCLGAGLLGAFTVLATLLAHPYWTFSGAGRVEAFNAFYEHFGLVGGLFFAAATRVNAESEHSLG